MVGQNKGENCTMNRILIIDDDRELCALIKRSVQTENIAADFCNTGKEGLQKLKEQEYQLVILDVMMPGMDGFETLEEIRKEHSLPILMFTSKNDSISKVRGLRAGADDYLTKPFSVEELLARLRVMGRRLSSMQSCGKSDSLFVNGDLKIDYAAGCAYLSDEELHLTPIEYKLLCLLSKNVGKVLTHTFITQKIWGAAWESNVASLRVFMATLRKKIEPSPDSPQYIQTHVGIGYRMAKLDGDRI